MDYKGQICSACGKPMGEKDDIVVCPVCGTPQHRECWEENGECIAAAKHEQGYAWQPEPVKEENRGRENSEGDGDDGRTPQRCAVCGSENPPDALTCLNCGAPISNPGAGNPFSSFFNSANPPGNPFLYGVTLDPDDEIEGAKVRDIVCCVQSNSSRYTGKFKALSDKTKKVSFNWAAFFLSPYWFFYRKMWKIGLFFAGLFLAVSLAFTGVMQDFQEIYFSLAELDMTAMPEAELMSVMDQLYGAMLKLIPMFAINMVFRIAAGFAADPLYKKHVISQTKKLRARFPGDRDFEAASLRQGGTSIFIAFAVYFGYNIVYNLLLSFAAYLIN